MKRLWVVGSALLAVSCSQKIESAGNPSVPRAMRRSEVAPKPKPNKTAPSAVQASFEKQVQNALYAGEGDLLAKDLRKRIAANPNDLEARLEMGRHYLKQGFPELALEHFRIASERFPDDARVVALLAEALATQDQTEQAATMLQGFLNRNQAMTSELPSILGLLRDQLEEYPAGESAHRAALALQSSNPKLHNNLGYNLWLQGKREEAVAAFRQALSLDSAFTVARNNLGMALMDSPVEQDRREAVGHFEAAAGRPAAHSNAAAILITQGRYDEARRELEQSLAAQRDYSPALKNLELLSRMDQGMSALPASARSPKASLSWKTKVWRAVLGVEDKSEPAGVTLATRK